jgi:hypothetical protein
MAISTILKTKFLFSSERLEISSSRSMVCWSSSKDCFADQEINTYVQSGRILHITSTDGVLIYLSYRPTISPEVPTALPKAA